MINNTVNFTRLVGKSKSAGSGDNRVRFNHMNEVTKVESLDEMSDDEIASMWYNDKEKFNMNRSIYKTVKMFQKDASTCRRCIRGLEHMISPECMEQRIVNRDCVYLACFSEQQRQTLSGDCNPERIRNRSAAASQWARNMAINQGAKDAVEAKLIHGKS